MFFSITGQGRSKGRIK